MSPPKQSSAPTPRFIDALLVDMQGRLRSKRLPASQRSKLLDGQTRMPLSTLSQDIFGEDRDALTGIGLADGDPDGVCVAAPHTLAVQPWNRSVEQVIVSLHDRDGAPSPFDPRALLQRQCDMLGALGYRATVAIELEFYVFDGATRDTGVPQVPRQLSIAGAPNPLQLSDVRVMDRIEPLLERIHTWAAELDVPTEATLAEFGPGQFEINLRHRSDPLRAADDAVLLRRIVDRAALHEGLVASFMAKPYTEHGGCGQHVHMSLQDERGNAVFDAASATQTVDVHGVTLASPLAHSLARLLDTLPDAQLIFAPHGNSYRRLQPDSFAPHRIDWAVEHRGVAIRLPDTQGANARFEHRVPGSDACGHLVLSALLAACRQGLASAQLPSSAPLLPGEVPCAEALSHDWLLAVDRFARSDAMRDAYGERFVEVFAAIKRAEALEFQRQVGSIDWQIWLPRV